MQDQDTEGILLYDIRRTQGNMFAVSAVCPFVLAEPLVQHRRPWSRVRRKDDRQRCCG